MCIPNPEHLLSLCRCTVKVRHDSHWMSSAYDLRHTPGPLILPFLPSEHSSPLAEDLLRHIMTAGRKDTPSRMHTRAGEPEVTERSGVVAELGGRTEDKHLIE